MTNEELEGVMNFIIKRQENFSDVLQQQQALMGTVIESQNILTETALRIAEAHDAQIVELRESVNSLTRTVERYITARGTNGNGSNGEG